MSAPLFVAKDLTRIIGEEVPVTLVKSVNLTIDGNDLIAITGPSGSGKSSLLYLLGLLDQPTSGTLLFEGQDTTSLNSRELAQLRLEKLGFIFQFHFLLPEFSVLDNVTMPMRKLGKLGDKAIDERAHMLLEDLGLEGNLHKKPGQLSGGQRQRVAIARALANNPTVILADEPTGNLDSKNADTVFGIFEKLAKEQDKTVITVTHEPSLAARCNRQIHIVDGKIESDVRKST